MGWTSTGGCLQVGGHNKAITWHSAPYKVYGVIIDGRNRITDTTDEVANKDIDIVRIIPPTLALSNPNPPSIALTTRSP